MPSTRVTINQTVLGAIAVDPQGPVMVDLLKRGLRVQAAAKRLCPVDTGRLRSSIQVGFGGDGKGRYVKVGTNVNYALAVHEGARPHQIRPKQAKVLRFKSGGQVIFAAAVRHPGTRGRPFLRDALPAARG